MSTTSTINNKNHNEPWSDSKIGHFILPFLTHCVGVLEYRGEYVVPLYSIPTPTLFFAVWSLWLSLQMGGVVVVGSYIFHFSKIWRSFPKLSTYISSKLCTQNSIFIFHSHLSTYTVLDNRNWLMNHDLSIKCESILDNIKIQKLGIARYSFLSNHHIH